MKKVVRLTESELMKLVGRIVKEQEEMEDDENAFNEHMITLDHIANHFNRNTTEEELDFMIDEIEYEVGSAMEEELLSDEELDELVDYAEFLIDELVSEFRLNQDFNSDLQESKKRVMKEQVKTLTIGSKGGAMINSTGNRPGHFNFVVKKVLGSNKYMVTISKWEFNSEFAKVGDSGTLTVGNKDASLKINGQVIDQLMMESKGNIKEQKDLSNLSILYECIGMAPNAHLDEVSQGLDTIFDATQGLMMDSDFDEDMIVKGLGELQTSEVRNIQRYLSCFMKKTNIQMADNNPLLTICRKAFTTFGSTDFGDSGLKSQAEKQLKRLGIQTKI